jgi:hypothetical protein
MTALQNIAETPLQSQFSAHESRSLWSRWLERLVGATRSVASRSVDWTRLGVRDQSPVYRISRAWENRWVVERPGAPMEHAFPDLEQAVSFVRHESRDAPATVELRIAELYVVAHFDPRYPGSLFGEAV